MLAEMHMVEPVGRRRYRLHDLLHAYVRQRAGQEDTLEERDEALLRMASWYARTALAADPLVFPGLPVVPVEVDAGPEPVPLADRGAAMSWLTTELHNLLGALRVATERGWSAAAIGLAASVRFLTFRERGLWPLRQQLLVQAKAHWAPPCVSTSDTTGPLAELADLLSQINGSTVFNGGIQVFHVGSLGLGPEQLAEVKYPECRDRRDPSHALASGTPLRTTLSPLLPRA